MRGGGVFDYVVSRGVLEHVTGGVDVAMNLPYSKRMIISVPYKEKPGNEHHVHLDMDEKTFCNYPNAEFIYEDLAGQNDINLLDSTNIIHAVISKDDCKIGALTFPLPPFTLSGIERLFFESYVS